MKKSCVGAVLGLAVAAMSAYAQGNIYLYTYNFSQTNQVTYGAGSGGTVGVPVSDTFKAGVYWADGIVTVTSDPTGVADPSTLGALTLGAGDGSEGPMLQGYIVTPNSFAMAPQTNTVATVVVVVYNGTSYMTSTVRGHSVAFQVQPTRLPLIPPTIGDVMPGFSVFPAEVAPTTNPPAFTQQPTNSRVNVGASVTFSTTVTGEPPLAYQWRFNGTNIGGANGAAYYIASAQASQAGSYSVRVTNLFGSVLSSNAVLTVVAPPTFLTQPTNRTVIAGSATTFAAGVSGASPLTFQWRFNGTNIAGATNLNYSIGSVQASQAGAYTLRVTNLFGSATSSNAQLTVVSAPSITQQPTNRTVNAGSPAAFSATVSGTAPLSYQWRLNGVNLTNATNLTYSIAAAQTNQAGLYSLRVTNLYGAVTSSNALLTVTVSSTNPTPTCVAPVAGLVSWWPGENNANDVIGSNPGVLQNGINYGTAEVGNGFVLDGVDDVLRVPASSNLNLGTQPGFTLEAWINPSGMAAGAPIFEWNKDDATQTGLHLWAGHPDLAANYLLANIYDGVGDHVLTTASGSLVSNVWQHVALTYSKSNGVARLFINGVLQTEQNVGSISVRTIGNLYMGARLGTVQPRYFKGIIDEPSVYNRALTTNEIAAIYAADGQGKCVPALVAPAITQQPTNRSVFVGSLTTFNVAVVGTAPFAYQWRFNGTDINDATNASYSILTAQTNQAGLYSVRITNEAGAVISTNAVLTVVTPTPPTITQNPTNRTVVAGSAVTFTSAATGTGTLAYQWRWNGTNIAGATSSTYSIAAVQENQAGLYSVRVTNLYGGADSTDALLTVLPPPPVPAIFSFAPAKAAVGEVVHLVGTNFSSVADSNIVYFGAVKAVVAGATSNSLDVVVPSGATYAPPSVGVAGLSGQASLAFMPTYIGPGVIDGSSFAPKVDLAAGTGQATVAVGDLDGDGKPDLLVANFAGTNVSIYRNISSNGSITADSFAPRINLGTGSYPYAYLADVDGDGKLDILVANNGNGAGNSISIFRNTSTPGVLTNLSFAARVNFTTPTGPLKIAAGDLDGDGKTDLAVSTGNARVVSLFRNIGTPGVIGSSNTFAARFDLGTNIVDRDIELADLDGDGKLDIVTSYFGAGTVSVLRNVATRGSLTTNSFAPRVILNSGSAYNVGIGDVDGDGKLDLVVDNRPTGVGVIRNLSTPGNISSNTFEAKVSYATANETYAVAIGDVDGDGRPDLAVANLNTSVVSLLRNTSVPGTINSNSFAANVDFAVGSGPRLLALADFDADGKPDLAVANLQSSFVSVLKNTSQIIGPTGLTVTPTNWLVNEGQTVSFTASVTGTPPFTYQWQFGSNAIGGANSSTLTLSNVVFAQAGNYSVVVSNAAGVAVSSNATLLVNRAPVADASATLALVVSLNGSNAIVTLDGSRSNDADSNALVYAWFITGASNALATGAVANVTLPLGTNQLTLVVNDGMAAGSQNLSVEVLTTDAAFDELRALVQSAGLRQRALLLLAALRTAENAIDHNHLNRAIARLRAFQYWVGVLVQPTDPELAAQLVQEAQAIITALGTANNPAPNVVTISSISVGVNGRPHLKISGQSEKVYIVEVSTNASDWAPLGEATETDAGLFEFDDATSQAGARFYRVVAPE